MADSKITVCPFTCDDTEDNVNVSSLKTLALSIISEQQSVAVTRFPWGLVSWLPIAE